MRIAVITDYASSGGASVAATRLCTGLRDLGHTIGRFYFHPPAPSVDSADACYPLTQGTLWVQQLSMHMQNRPWRWFSQRIWVKAFRKALREFGPDIINLHNLHGANWDIEVVEECLRHAPVVWTMHDMWPLTGSCAHSFDCRKFVTQCDRHCPQQRVYPTLPARMVAAAHRRRQNLYDRKPNLHLVAPSQWLAAQADEMVRDRVSVKRISNGLDLELFRPLNKASAREILRIPQDGRPCILASATSLSDKNKGIGLLLEALSMLRDSHVRLLLMGPGDIAIQSSEELDIVRLGAVRGEALLPIIYNAADLLVHPSLAENQPLVIMEALACGVPPVATPSGGVPEMIEEGKTGWLASSITAASLAEEMLRALGRKPEWPEYSRICRKHAEEEFSIRLAATRYESLFKSAKQIPS